MEGNKMTKCDNCGKPIGKVGVLSPTLDPKKRVRCTACAEREYFCVCKKPMIAYGWDGARCLNPGCGKEALATTEWKPRRKVTKPLIWKLIDLIRGEK